MKTCGWLLAVSALVAGVPWAPMAAAQDGIEYRAAVLRVDAPGPMPISRLDLPPDDLGFAGASLGTADNATTGSFMQQTFVAETVAATPETVEAEMQELLDAGVWWIVTLADAETTVRLADLAGDQALVLNASATDDRLRGEDCRANLLHVAPSDAMVADALAQFLVWKRWIDWFLIEGSHPEDQALAAAYRRSAEKFGAEIVEERVFEDTGGARRTDSGTVQVQGQMPTFTQRAPEHDVVVAADRAGVFAAHLPYHTWDPRPVAGSAGLVPETWHPAHEAWGATQWQTRFETRGEPHRLGRGLSGVDGDPRARRGGDPHAGRRLRDDPGLRAVGPVRPRRLQGPEADLPRLGRPAAPADPPDGGHGGGLGLAAVRVPAPDEPARHPRDRPARDDLPALTTGRARCAPRDF